MYVRNATALTDLVQILILMAKETDMLHQQHVLFLFSGRAFIVLSLKTLSNSHVLNDSSLMLRLPSTYSWNEPSLCSAKQRIDETNVVDVINNQRIQNPVILMGHKRANNLLFLNVLTLTDFSKIFRLNPKYSYQTLNYAWIGKCSLPDDEACSKLHWNWLTSVLMGRTFHRVLMDQSIMKLMASTLNVSYIL